jgi:uncharacterized protein YqhQ
VADEHQHFYGGQAVIEGVMMRAPERWAVAVRRASGRVNLFIREEVALGRKYVWARRPLIRGCVGIYESLGMGWYSLQASATMAMDDALPEGAKRPKSSTIGALSGVLAAALGIGLFFIFPTVVTGWIVGVHAPVAPHDVQGSIVKNAIEGGVRLVIILLYIGGVGFMPDIRRVFQYHGAEHATINCYEAGEPVTVDNVMRHSVLHPRCGTSFLLTVVFVKLVVNCFLGWPALWIRVILRIAILPVVAALAYEAIYYAGRHRDGLFARIMAAPGMAVELLTTRHHTRDQAEIAIYALAAVAPDVPLPADLEPADIWTPVQSTAPEGVPASVEATPAPEDAPLS